MEQLLTLVLGGFAPVLGALEVSAGFVLLADQLSSHCLPDGLGLVFWQTKRAVEVVNAVLDALQAHSRAVATALLCLLQAQVVLVRPAVPGVLGVDEPTTADRAVDRAPQVVPVHAVFLATVGVGGKQVLHCQPDLRLNEGRMLALVVDAPI
nr:hypothetical protein [Catenulispora acidiphila]